MIKYAEISTYKLKQGARAQFDDLVRQQSWPMLQKHGVVVLAFGPSVDEEDAYLLVRGYRDRVHRDEEQADFYGSDDWLRGPRAAIVALIEEQISVFVSLDANPWLQMIRSEPVLGDGENLAAGH